MSSHLSWTPEQSVRLTRFAAIATGVVFGLSIAIFGGIALLSNSRAAAEEARAKQVEQDTVAVRKVLDDARSKVAVRVRSQSKAIADFQQSVTQIATSSACAVEEFLSSTEVQPFLTRFLKQGQVDGWSQIEIQLVLTGSGPSIVGALTQLSDQPVPIEFNSIQMLREGVDENGARIKAKVQLRVLVQASGEPA